MTKMGVFKLISTLVIFVTIVALCVVEDRLVTTSLQKVKAFCYQIESAAEKNDGIVNGEVASLVENMEIEWKHDESKLCLLVNHKSIEQLGVEIVRMKTYIDEDEEIEFFTSLEIIKSYVESFQHMMGASFHNVL